MNLNRACALCALLLLLAPNAGGAPNQISLYVDDPVEGLVTFGTVAPGSIFEIVAITKMSEPSAGAEFVMTELTLLYGGVFKIDTTRINDTTLDLGANDLGEYMISFGSCEPAGELEIVRLRYAEATDVIRSTTLEIRGFGPGDTQPSSYLGYTSYRDCEGVAEYLEPEPSMRLLSGACGPPPGSCVLNPAPGLFRCSGTEDISFAALKSRF